METMGGTIRYFWDSGYLVKDESSIVIYFFSFYLIAVPSKNRYHKLLQ